MLTLCYRITPGTGYLEALGSKNVDVHFGGVSKITQTGLEMEDGTMFGVDAIVCATGFVPLSIPPSVSFACLTEDRTPLSGQRFPLSGRTAMTCETSGKTSQLLICLWQPLAFQIILVRIQSTELPVVNSLTFAVIGGPNFTFANGVFLISVETAWNYVFQVIEKVQTEGIISLSPKQRAVDDFQTHKDTLMKDMVWTGPCASW